MDKSDITKANPLRGFSNPNPNPDFDPPEGEYDETEVVPAKLTGEQIVSGIASLEDEQLNRRKLFLKLCVAWLVFFMLTAALAYFALPLVGISLFPVLLGPIITSLSPIAVAFIVIGLSAFTSTLLSSFVFIDKKIADNFSTNFNFYRWHQIFPQIFSNAYHHTKTEGKVSPWQIINLIAHLHFIVGGLQLILNKAFHQLYNKKVTYKSGQGAKEVKRNTLVNLSLLIPRIVLAVPFLLVLLPLNLIGSFVEQVNHALYRLAWYWQNKDSFNAAEKGGHFAHLSPASQAANSGALEWVTRSNNKAPGHRGHGLFPQAATTTIPNPLHDEVPKAGQAKRTPRDGGDASDTDTAVTIPRTAPPAGPATSVAEGTLGRSAHSNRPSVVLYPSTR